MTNIMFCVGMIIVVAIDGLKACSIEAVYGKVTIFIRNQVKLNEGVIAWNNYQRIGRSLK